MPEKLALLGGGTGHQYPLKTFLRQKSASRDTYDKAFKANNRARVEWIQDFLGDLSATDIGIEGSLYDISPAGSPTNTILANGAHGQLQTKFSSTNELQIEGYTWGDQRIIPAFSYPFFETRIGFKTLPTTNERAIFGLASALSGFGANWDGVATSLWFRMEASGALVIEYDDGTNTADDVATGVTLAVETWYTLSFFAQPNGKVAFYVADKYGANEVRVGLVDVPALDGTLLQPVALMMKDSGAGVPDLRNDYISLAWHRIDTAFD